MARPQIFCQILALNGMYGNQKREVIKDREVIIKRRVLSYNREVKHDVNGRRQTAKIISDFEFFSSNP